ncbi:hypothetical protein D3C80_1421680 [compost metagenome]
MIVSSLKNHRRGHYNQGTVLCFLKPVCISLKNLYLFKIRIKYICEVLCTHIIPVSKCNYIIDTSNIFIQIDPADFFIFSHEQIPRGSTDE